MNRRIAKLADISLKYQELLLEYARIQEKCNLLDDKSHKYDSLQFDYKELEKENCSLKIHLEQERKNLAEKINLLEHAEEKFRDTFKALSSEALSNNNQSFLDLAKAVFAQIQEQTKADLNLNNKFVGDLINPIKSALTEVGTQLGELEKSRIGAYEALKQQVGDLINSQNSLKAETNNLVSALKAPSSRGRWGEMQLRRVLELSGMVEHCDFQEQVFSVNCDKMIRPDMIIYYPGDKKIVVDAKVPLDAYLKAQETNDPEKKKSLLNEHAKQIKNHVINLSKKEYWAQFQPSPEFVIMFLPGEIFFSAAMEQDPSLIEFAMREKIVISTPTTLLALLHTIAWGWRQENLSENAKHIEKLGQELYKRLNDMTEHFRGLGKSITAAVTNYNQVVASLESRVLVSARKFRELNSSDKNILELNSVEETTRQLKNE